jgi:hypothetical protein
VPIDELEQILSERQVQLRGWYVPHISSRDTITSGEDWIGQESSFSYHVESWKFYTRGQVALGRGLEQDWRDGEYSILGSALQISQKRLQVWAVLYFFTEVLELAARLSLSSAGSERMSLRLVTAGVAGRQLVIEDPARSEFDRMYIASEDEIVFDEEVSREHLVADSTPIAVRAAQQVFRGFGWRSDHTAILTDYQATFLKR